MSPKARRNVAFGLAIVGLAAILFAAFHFTMGQLVFHGRPSTVDDAIEQRDLVLALAQVRDLQRQIITVVGVLLVGIGVGVLASMAGYERDW